MRRFFLAGLFLVVFILEGNLVFAGGTSLSGQGSRAISMGGAFTAVADDGSSIYYNPAGMSQIKGTQIQTDALLYAPKIEYEMLNGAIQKSTKSSFGPGLFVTHTFTDRLSGGFGVYSQYARASNLNSDPANGFLSMRASTSRIDLSPVLSYSLNDNISIGGGLIVGYGQVDQSVPASALLRINDKGDGFGLGGIAGLIWRLNEYIKLGGTYRTRMEIDIEGERTLEQQGIKLESDSSAETPYPSSIGLGIALMPNNRLTLAFDIDWTEWSYLDKIVTKTDLWPDSTTFFNADDSWDIRLGSEYKLPHDLALRAGYAYSQHAVPNTHISPAIPDADGHGFHIGMGKILGSWKFDLLYSYAFTLETEPSGNIYGYNGKYNVTQHLFGLTATCMF